MKVRKMVSLISVVSFVVMIVTSIILFVVPQGRVAYWADWRLWGLSKEQWGDIHINTGFLFLITLGLHLYYNWKPFVSYLKNKAKALKIFTKEFNVALFIVILVGVGTWMEIPPFRTVLAISDHFKDAGAVKYGEPPYGHAELSSLKTFTKKMSLDLEESVQRLGKAGLSVESESQTLSEIAKMNQKTPQQIYLAIEPAKLKSDEQPMQEYALPQNPPPGIGNRTLADICSLYNLSIKKILRGLKDAEINATEEMTIKKIAEENRKSPTDIYEELKALSLK